MKCQSFDFIVFNIKLTQVKNLFVMFWRKSILLYVKEIFNGKIPNIRGKLTVYLQHLPMGRNLIEKIAVSKNTCWDKISSISRIPMFILFLPYLALFDTSIFPSRIGLIYNRYFLVASLQNQMNFWTFPNHNRLCEKWWKNRANSFSSESRFFLNMVQNKTDNYISTHVLIQVHSSIDAF